MVSYINAIGAREALLRDRGLTQVQWSELTDVDWIDLTGNELTVLRPSLSLPRLRGLMAGSNKISQVLDDIGGLVPNLEVLALQDNALQDVEQFQFLRSLRNLTHLLVDPVGEEWKLKILRQAPWIRFINYERVTEADRSRVAEASPDSSSSAGPASKMDVSERRQELLQKLENATNLEEIDVLEALLAGLS